MAVLSARETAANWSGVTHILFARGLRRFAVAGVGTVQKDAKREMRDISICKRSPLV
jgi:hypothetical protein